MQYLSPLVAAATPAIENTRIVSTKNKPLTSIAASLRESMTLD
jgi:hypothetical protein